MVAISNGHYDLSKFLLDRGADPNVVNSDGLGALYAVVETQWAPAGLRTRGSSSAVVVRTIRQILGVQGEVGSNLVLAGDWDLRIGESVDGFASLRRVRGDVRLGEPRQAMGLEAVNRRAEAAGGRVKAAMGVRGSRIGNWRAEGDATLRAGESGWEVSPAAPLAGRFELDVPPGPSHS